MADLLPFPRGATVRGDRVYLYGVDIGAMGDFDLTDAASQGDGYRTWGDVQRQRAANAREVGWNAGIGAAGSLTQLALGAIPTATDARNADRLAALTAAEKAGRLGLSADERALAEATILNPVRTIATQANEATAMQMAAAPTASLASQAAARQANQRAAQDAAVKAGIAINAAEIQARKDQVQELEERTKDKAEQQAALISRGANIVGDLAKMGGKIAAAQAAKVEPSDAELLTMSKATTADGKTPAYPSYYNKAPDEIRTLWRQQQALERAQSKKPLFGTPKPKAKTQTDVNVPEPVLGDFLDAGSASTYG